MTSAVRFFDDPRYLSTVVAEKAPAESAAQAMAAARLAACGNGASILDAGCGNGRHALPLAHDGFRVVGLDRSQSLLAAALRARSSGRWPRFVLGSYTAIPIESGTLNAVLSLGTALGYLGDGGDRTALSEFRRVLAPGGRIVLETLHSAAIGEKLREREERSLVGGGTLRFERRFERARRVMRETQRLEDCAAAGPPRAYDIRVYSERELCRMLERAGFAIVGRHASLAGDGEPSPGTPLVLVAEAR